MILSALRDYVRDRGQVSLAELTAHFDTDADTARAMLDVWIRKQKLYRRSATACGGACTHCSPAIAEYYVWGQPPEDGAATVTGGCPSR